MILPEKLNTGDTIAFYSPAAPASATAPKRFARALEYLSEKGFNLVSGDLTGKKDFYRAGTPLERAGELNKLIRNPDIKCIISVMGGLNSNSLLPYIDYAAFRETPKILVGYSDVTAIQLGVYAQTNVITFYGPALIPSFGEFPPFVDDTFSSFRDILMEPKSPYQYEPFPFWTDEFINWEEWEREKEGRENEWVPVNPGKAQGRAICGNLNSITGIWGSPYMPEIKENDILLIEDTAKTASFTEKLFTFLKLNGVFERIGGLILGKHERFDDQGTGRKPWDILLETVGDVNFPILAEFDCSHTHPMFTFPIGAAIALDARAGTVTLVDDWIKK